MTISPFYVQYLTKEQESEQACLFTLQEQSKLLLDLHHPMYPRPRPPRPTQKA